MINKIQLKNFKLFNNHQIELSPMTILAGANGAGKSSVIQAILLLKQAVEVNELNKNEVSLNGPYLLQLGTVKNVISADADSEKIGIKMAEQEDFVSFEFDFDIDRLPISLNISNSEIANCKFNEAPFYYLNAERIGPRKALEMNSSMQLETGHKGEFTNYVMHQADILKLEIHEELLIEGVPKTFTKQVEAWFQSIIPDIELNLAANYDVNMTIIKYKNTKDTDFYIPTATGFGITYALPIIVSGLIASSKNDSLFIVENPEAHLHPYGQSCIGKFLAILSTVGVQVILETHSEHVVNGARLQLAQMGFSDNLLINFFEKNNKDLIRAIRTNKLGELSSWPIGFFDQQQYDLRELLRLKRK
ncbi:MULTISPECIES: DUF3696 domain-containing protein [Bacillus]|uniref:AAA family ATPase n=1 Tax=Bacillus TaxID=1386 RepID=UPI000BEB4117|nr:MULTISPECIES: DUF3696 domain-containing protein [Bacillus]KAB2372583.1 DUF3696 domain-containing protein [Bacillus sp. RM2(2019)]PEG02530.1 hypothetical protein CON54_22835 [Bacillus cereus]PFH98183.1 hypothetical protein COI64_28155 [Bacillus cereus]PGK97803.1 hypothetical protein CN910_08865 [Bacillus cereus]